MRSVGLVSKILDRLKYLVFKQELVGIDQVGNKYYRYPDKNAEGVPVEKRIVDLFDGEYDPNSIPPEWSSWLHRFRDEPPTETEIESMKAERQAMKERVAVLEEEEKKRQIRIKSLEAQGLSADAGPNMSKFVEQLVAKGYGGSSAPSEPSSGASGPSQTPSGSSGEDFQPQAWKPGKS